MLAIDAGIGLGELRPYGGAADGRSCRYQVGILRKSLRTLIPKVGSTKTKSSSWFCKVTFIFMRNCKWGMLLFCLFLYCKMVLAKYCPLKLFHEELQMRNGLFHFISLLHSIAKMENGQIFHWTSIEQLYCSTCKTEPNSPHKLPQWARQRAPRCSLRIGQLELLQPRHFHGQLGKLGGKTRCIFANSGDFND